MTSFDVSAGLLNEVIEWVSIPSISTEPGHEQDLERGAEWVMNYLRASGAECRLERRGDASPLVIGRLAASAENAPTVLVYGHYDVQSPGPLDAWHTPPFVPKIRDGRLYGRGAADNKGNFWPLVHVACELARDGTLPVNVDVLVDGEEEIGGETASAWLKESYAGADVAIVYDAWMVDEETPAITVGLRGLIAARVEVRTGARSVHSGVYGGAALNAMNVLNRMLASVLPDAEGRVPAELRGGVTLPSEREIADWAALPSGARRLEEVGSSPLGAAAAGEFYLRTGWEPSLDINAVHGGEPRTIIPASASAFVTLRVAPGQDALALQDALRRLLLAGAPPEADVAIDGYASPGYQIDAGHPAIVRAIRAMERASGKKPVLVRIGGSVPIVPQIAALGIPVIVGGFKLPGDAIHAPDESFRLGSLKLAESWARELLEELRDLPAEVS